MRMINIYLKHRNKLTAIQFRKKQNTTLSEQDNIYLYLIVIHMSGTSISLVYINPLQFLNNVIINKTKVLLPQT